MYKKLLEGHISFGGIQDALEAVNRLRDTKNGVLQIISQDCSGLIGIFCGRYVTGAVLTLSGETGNRLRKLLASKEGKFTFLDAGDDDLADLKQSLGVDIELLLSSGLRPDALPTDEALSGLLVSGDNIKTINTDDEIVLDTRDENRLHRLQRTYDRLLSLSQQQALEAGALADQVLAESGPPATSGMDGVIAQRKAAAESMSPLDMAPPPPAAEMPTAAIPSPMKPAGMKLSPPAQKPPIPPWDEPWEPPVVPVEPVQPTEFKRIKKWDQQSPSLRLLPTIFFLIVMTVAALYLLPHVAQFLSHLP